MVFVSNVQFSSVIKVTHIRGNKKGHISQHYTTNSCLTKKN